LQAVRRYHDGTKHHFQQFARSLGYLDWASQPHPFRAYAETAVFRLFPAPGVDAAGYRPRPVAYDRLFETSIDPEIVSAAALGDLLRHSLGLSAWKRFRPSRPSAPGRASAVESRWSLRVNPSSGNLHPTEAYVVCAGLTGLADSPAVYHYAAERHALEQRCAFDPAAWASACGAESRQREVVLVVLTSIHWRESWKYGERAFRYCQHDLGHAIAAVGLAATMFGWRVRLLPAWPHRSIASLVGLDREGDFDEAEREDPGCVLAIARGEIPPPLADGGQQLVAAVRRGRWSGRASQLSEDHVQWTFIDEVTAATEDPGHILAATVAAPDRRRPGLGARRVLSEEAREARALILQRRSAVAFDGRSTMARQPFFGMLARVMPSTAAPWNGLWWPPHIHLALFVHRVDDLAPGLYLLPRRQQAVDQLRAAFGREFLWDPVAEEPPLICLARGDCRRLAARLSCDQDIAGDGFFSLGMIAEFEDGLATFGPAFYRNLFWESGVVGQLLYLEAEAAAARATGIGCFFDDPVHEVFGLRGHTFQSLYHFSVGTPVEDVRLTTEPGYDWELGH
jgi:SagB-type dehydrogenase family enzyme